MGMSKAELPEFQVLTDFNESITHGYRSVIPESADFKLLEVYTQPLWRTDDESGKRDERNSNPIESLAY